MEFVRALRRWGRPLVIPSGRGGCSAGPGSDEARSFVRWREVARAAEHFAVDGSRRLMRAAPRRRCGSERRRSAAGSVTRRRDLAAPILKAE